MKTFHIFLLMSGLLISAAAAEAAPADKLDIEITKTPLEDLLNIEVTSVSKRPEQVRGAAAAVYVLTGEEIQRAGVRTIPDALRLVPGVQVAAIDANKSAVSIRGFNSRTSNKLLVLIDGRTVYDPLFSGVLWEATHVMLEDIDRIEVIRGPGGTVWGSNAVNGIINIITKNARETVGTYAAAGGGSEERYFASARQGAEISDETFGRVFADFYRRDSGYLEEGADDDSHRGQAGFRIDSNASERDMVTFQGDYHQGEYGLPHSELRSDEETEGFNILGRWSRALAPDSGLSLQLYYDRSELVTDVLSEDRDSIDVEFLHHLKAYERHALVWGLRYRYTADDVVNSEVLALDPDSRRENLVSAFVQDEIALFDRELFLTLGSKFEYNTSTQVELQPTVRLSWQPEPDKVTWAAVSRAVRVPSRLEEDLIVTLESGEILSGSRDLESEQVIAYEIGHRRRLGKRVFLDAALFYNTYYDLVTLEGDVAGNGGEGDTYGVEFAATLDVLPWWRVVSSYAYLQMDLELDSGSIGDPQELRNIEGSNPHNDFSIHSRMDLPYDLKFDAILRYVDNLPAQGVSSYLVADARLAAQLTDELELSVVARNLFDEHHFERSGSQVSQVETGVYGMLRLKF